MSSTETKLIRKYPGILLPFVVSNVAEWRKVIDAEWAAAAKPSVTVDCCTESNPIRYSSIVFIA